MQNEADYQAQLPSIKVADQGLLLAASHEELLEQLTHTVGSIGGILVIEGSPNSGKTTLAGILRRDRLDHCARLGLVTVAPGAAVRQILNAAAAALGLPVKEEHSAGELLTLLRDFNQLLQAQSAVGALVVDDAHHLDIQTLAALASLLPPDAAVPGLRLLLWSEPGLVDRLDSLPSLNVPVHDFGMPLLTRQETAVFAEHLAQAEIDLHPHKSFALSDADVQELWLEAGGCVGLVEELVRERWQQSSLKAPSRTLAGLPVTHLAALSLLVVALVWALSAGKSGDGVSGKTVALPVPLTVAPAVDQQANHAMAPKRSGVMPARQNEPTHPLAGTVVADLEPVIGEKGLRNAIYGTSTVVPETTPEPESESHSQSGPIAEQVERVTTPARATPERPQIPAADADLLLSFDPASYSLQVMATSSLESLERFRQRQPNRAQLYLYHTRRQGHRRYILIAGNYPSREAAVAAIEHLPRNQQAQGPWPRMLANVHAEIVEDRRN